MKKTLTFLSFLFAWIGAMAQDGHWTVLPGYENPNEYVAVVATFVTNETSYNSSGTIGVYEVAAFVGDETQPRAIATPRVKPNSPTEAFQVELHIAGNIDPSKGDEDGGKPITFRVYNARTGMEYNLVSSNNVTWAEGSDYVTTTLTLTAATGVTLAPITMNVGETVDLTDYMTIEPLGASLPANVAITWSLGNFPDAGTISGNMLTAAQPGKALYHMEAPFYSDEASLDILAPATGIAINEPSAITYRIGNYTDKLALAELLSVGANNPHYTVTPANTTDDVSWQYEDPSQTIIGYSAEGTLSLLGPGTVKVRPIVTKADQTVLYPANPDWITITVVQPVTDVIVDWDEQQYQFKANVGDDVYSRIASRVEILPATATNKGYSFSIMLPTGGPVPEGAISQDGSHLTFNQEGQYYLTVIPDDDPDFTGPTNSLNIFVENPAKTISFKENPLVIMKNEYTTVDDIARAINANIELADGYSSYAGTITVTGTAVNGSGTVTGNGARVNLGNGFQDGSSTVSVTMTWNDYSNYDGTPGSIGTAQSDPFTFTVSIASQLAGFNVYHKPGDAGQGTLTFVPIPAEAQYDFAIVDVNVKIAEYPETWRVLTATRNNDANGNTFVITYNSELPGHVMVDAGDLYTLYNGDKTDVSEVFTGFDIAATYNFAAGWQWRTNSYGDVSDNQTAEFFNNTFLTSFGEARTQSDLLINDAEWGLYGSLYDAGILQGDCYKIRMKEPASTTLTTGFFNSKGTTVVLNKNWTWVGNPYVYDRAFAEAFDLESLDLPEGTRIVSKNDGFAVWTPGSQTAGGPVAAGKWTGNLNTLKKNEGYLVYCPATKPEGGYVLHFNTEFNMQQGNGLNTNARAARQSVWSYDHSQFANNMSMIAELKNLDDASHYTVGAFVDGECRGEGIVVDGRAFITVHGNNGETVSFRLHNELTGEFFEVAETVKSQTMLGTMTAPVALTAPAIATGISRVENGACSTESYDLLGRKAVNSKITLRRMADGTVRKVVK